MKLDIRWPIGILFLLFGALIGGYGLRGDTVDAAYGMPNINLIWGVVLAVFGALMAVLAAVAGRRR